MIYLLLGMPIFPVNTTHCLLEWLPFGHTMCTISKFVTASSSASSIFTLSLGFRPLYILVSLFLKYTTLMTRNVMLGLDWNCLVPYTDCYTDCWINNWLAYILTEVDPVSKQQFRMERVVSSYTFCCAKQSFRI